MLYVYLRLLTNTNQVITPTHMLVDEKSKTESVYSYLRQSCDDHGVTVQHLEENFVHHESGYGYKVYRNVAEAGSYLLFSWGESEAFPVLHKVQDE